MLPYIPLELRAKIDQWRLQRYRRELDLPASAIVTIDSARKLTLDCEVEELQDLRDYLMAILAEAWLIMAARKVLVLARSGTQQTIIYAGPSLQTARNRSQYSENLMANTMTTATVEPTTKPMTEPTNNNGDQPRRGRGRPPLAKNRTQPQSSSQPRPQIPTIPVLPVLQVLTPLAQKTGFQEQEIAQGIQDLGCLVFFDAHGNCYRAEQDGIFNWVDGYLAKDLVNRRQRLLEEAYNASAPAIAAPVVTPPAPNATVGKSELPPEPTPKRSRRVRLKGFSKSSGYAKTWGKFLEAQGWTPARRVEITELMAALPAELGNVEDLAEQCMAKILEAYPKGDRDKARKGLIAAIRSELMGKSEVDPPSSIPSL